MTDPYSGREQTKAKHFILKRYLQALAFKVLRFSDIAYVDGFSGPWETQTEDFVDSSFMIAISVLKDAQQKIQTQTSRRPKIRCFFSESNRQAYIKLAAAIAPFHRPEEDFEIKTYCGEFEDAVAAQDVLKLLRELGSIRFSKLWVALLQAHMLRITNVKDVCVDLAKNGKIDNTWGGGTRKPRDEDMIKLS